MVPGNSKPQTRNNKPIPLFFWSERKFASKEKENYGDLLSKYLVEKISGRPVKWVHPKKQPWYKWDKRNYLGVGSILHHATKKSVVWGSGIIDHQHKIAAAHYCAVRGPRTRDFLVNSGYECPEVFGDPALLLPKYFSSTEEKKWKIGIIPHYLHYKEVAKAYRDEKDIVVIDLMTMDVEVVTKQIIECQATISSSLHGLIVSHAYGIPSVWVEFRGDLFGNGIKFLDYFESVDVEVTAPEKLEEKKRVIELDLLVKNTSTLPPRGKIKDLQEGLLNSFPLKITNPGKND